MRRLIRLIRIWRRGAPSSLHRGRHKGLVSSTAPPAPTFSLHLWEELWELWGLWGQHLKQYITLHNMKMCLYVFTYEGLIYVESCQNFGLHPTTPEKQMRRGSHVHRPTGPTKSNAQKHTRSRAHKPTEPAAPTAPTGARKMWELWEKRGSRDRGIRGRGPAAQKPTGAEAQKFPVWASVNSPVK